FVAAGRMGSAARRTMVRARSGSAWSSAFMVSRAAGPAPSVGGPRRGAPRLRSACHDSFHPKAAGPAPSVGGPRRGAPRLRSACHDSFHPKAAGPAPSVGGPRRGAPRLRSACHDSFHPKAAGPAPSAGGPRRGAPRLRSSRPFSFQAFGDELAHVFHLERPLGLLHLTAEVHHGEAERTAGADHVHLRL